MLKSIKSNNSPGHSHNRLPSVVDLSIDSCPGIILKRNNKMNKPNSPLYKLTERARKVGLILEKGTDKEYPYEVTEKDKGRDTAFERTLYDVFNKYIVPRENTEAK